MTTNLIHPTAEVTVLSAMLNLTPIGFSIASDGLDADDFHNPLNALIFAVLKERLVTDLPIDADTVAAEATNLGSRRRKKTRVLPSYVDELMKSDWKRAGAYAETVKQMAMLRRAETFANWFQQRIGEMPDAAEFYADAVEALRELQPEAAEDRFLPGEDTERWHADLLTTRRTTPDDELSLDWPWASWNRIVRPLRRGRVGLLAAPSGVGKSAYLEQIAEHWAAQGRNVVFAHLENDWAFTLDRRLARHARVRLEDIEAGNVPPDLLRDAMRSMGSFLPRLHYMHAAGWTMERILSEVATLVAQGRCDALVVDYGQKVRPSRRQREFYGPDQYAHKADDAEQLKTFAETHRIAALIASQMNKGGNDGFTRKSRVDVRGSQEVIDKVQLLILVSRELADSDQYNDQGELICEAGEYGPETLVQVGKQNAGRMGEWKQWYEGPFYTFRDMQGGGP